MIAPGWLANGFFQPLLVIPWDSAPLDQLSFCDDDDFFDDNAEHDKVACQILHSGFFLFPGFPPHIGPKSLILAPEDIPDISGYQLGFGRRFVKAYNTENPVTNQKIL